MDSIDKYVRSFQKSPVDRAGAIHPSSLGKCSRAAIYEYRGFEPDREWEDRELRVFAMGYLVEDFVADSHQFTGELIARNVPLMGRYQGTEVLGELDLLLYVDGGWSIADAKSVNSNSFGYGSFPYQHHCYQVGTYEWQLGQTLALSDEDLTKVARKLKPKNPIGNWESWYVMLIQFLRNGTFGPRRSSQIIYVSKDDLRIESWGIGEGAISLALTEIDKLVGHIELDTIPDRPFQSPEEHSFACAKRTRKGYQKKDFTYSPGREPLYVPKCRYFKRCWGVMPDEWNFWHEVVGDEAAPW
jgi:hypothetical protein